MANYNTFALVESKHGRILLVTSSARKASRQLCVGRRIEVWNDNEKVASATHKTREVMKPFIQREKEYIRVKQEIATNSGLASNKRKDSIR